MLDYYSAAKFDLLNSVSLHFDSQGAAAQRWHVKPALHGSYGEGLLGTMDNKIAFHMFAARKRPDSLEKAVPVQSFYGRKFTGKSCTSGAIEWFSPYEMEGGKRLASRKPTELPISSFAANGGLMWGAALPDSFPPGDNNVNPIASSLALFEDGKLLGPAHSSHETIRVSGGGSYLFFIKRRIGPKHQRASIRLQILIVPTGGIRPVGCGHDSSRSGLS
ncbi:hypothetical protein [Bradyrhizobium sp. AUGA SZCCT0042]|uniref:hypothetical protein n=1 Tax=Bradyrhizobium sp. AUGA SZCCT0042 TaxID=2807651 RepID=UPI001BAC5586|nr:hypothetical protein [Bradyrhizobium sp. AUGA SZCCT0042]MBR1301743.1 hypothetical protein [Bradyrhizobium sp. AUGA SZCCT0042]